MKDIFCAKCQKVTPHKATVDANGEFLFECLNMTLDDNGEQVLCDRFVKFPSDTDASTFSDTLTKHEQSNVGQVSLEAQEKKLQTLLDAEQPKLEQLESVPVEEVVQPVVEDLHSNPIE